METSEKTIPTFVLEDLLFQRRLHRSLNSELERLHSLLVEQVRLLRERDALMAKVHAAVQERWEKEEPASVAVRSEATEGEANHE
jgi:hypothetical protein